MLKGGPAGVGSEHNDPTSKTGGDQCDVTGSVAAMAVAAALHTG